jgi:biotin carboxyl carrier protein
MLKQSASNIDLTYAYKVIRDTYLHDTKNDAGLLDARSDVIDRKQSLLLRPLQQLLDRPHALSGWLSIHRADCSLTQAGDGKRGSVEWLCNPIVILDELYHYLNMEHREGRPAQDIIWDHDDKILANALAFYQSLEEYIHTDNFTELTAILAQASAPIDSNLTEDQWRAIRSAHIGFQSGIEILAVLPYIAAKTQFYQLSVKDDLNLNIPDILLEKSLQQAMQKELVPPLSAKSDEILAVSGGMFYSREAPTMQCYVAEGDHFEAGDVLYIVEVMKMFNKVTASFAGTIDKVLVADDGVIISKGQPLFKVTPDEHIVMESQAVLDERKREYTDTFLTLCAISSNK